MFVDQEMFEIFQNSSNVSSLHSSPLNNEFQNDLNVI